MLLYFSNYSKIIFCLPVLNLTYNLFCIFQENPQKLKKKKDETNGETEAKLNAKEAKPKKTKTKKSEDVSEEEGTAIQSEGI